MDACAGSFARERGEVTAKDDDERLVPVPIPALGVLLLLFGGLR